MAAVSTVIAGVSAAAGVGSALAAKKQQKATAAERFRQSAEAALNAKKQEAEALRRQKEQREAVAAADKRAADMLSAERETRLAAEKRARIEAERVEALNVQAGVTAKEKADLAAQAAGGKKATVVLGSKEASDTALTALNKKDVSGKKKKKSKSAVGGLFSGPTNVGGL